jgi:hydrogenase large subunit
VSTFAIENAMGWTPTGVANSGFAGHPTNKARLVRNLNYAAEFVMSNISHFYALSALDLVQAAQTDPTGTPSGVGMSPWTPSWDNSYYDQLLRADGQGGLSWDAGGNPNTIYTAVITDYVLALTARRRAVQIGGLFGGKIPFDSSRVPGGVTWNLTGAPKAAQIELARQLLYKGGVDGIPSGGTTGAPAAGTVLAFIQKHYIPMTEIVSVLHGLADNDQNSWWSIVSGLPGTRGPYANTSGLPSGLNIGDGCKNFLSWGVFETITGAPGNAGRLIKRGSVYGATNTSSGTWEDIDPADVFEYITNAHYRATDDAKNPYDNVTYPDTTRGYTWHKSPRYKAGLSADPTAVPATAVKEVGPLARMWISGQYTAGQTKAMRDHAFAGGSWPVGPTPLPPLGPGGLALSYKCGISVLDRHRARAREAELIALAMAGWLEELATDASPAFDGSKSIPPGGQGIGLSEAPRGSVAHWAKYDAFGHIANYAVISPTTWNASGRDISNNPGPIEQALQNNFIGTGLGAPVRGTPSNDKLIPVEALIVAHSFDPCIACSIHMVEPKKSAKKKLSKYEVEGGCKK